MRDVNKEHFNLGMFYVEPFEMLAVKTMEIFTLQVKPTLILVSYLLVLNPKYGGVAEEWVQTLKGCCDVAVSALF